MYQASIRDKKKHQKFHNVKTDNYIVNNDCEEYAYVKKNLGNCNLLVITNSGVEAMGVIRGKLRKFNTRIVIEVGDIVVVSKRDYQFNKVDIVHKYNPEQVRILINEGKLSNILINLQNNHFDTNEDIVDNINNDKYIEFDFISDDSSEDSL